MGINRDIIAFVKHDARVTALRGASDALMRVVENPDTRSLIVTTLVALEDTAASMVRHYAYQIALKAALAETEEE